MRHIIAPQAPCQWSTLGIETAFQHPSSILGASVKHKQNYYHSSLMLAQMEFATLSAHYKEVYLFLHQLSSISD